MNLCVCCGEEAQVTGAAGERRCWFCGENCVCWQFAEAKEELVKQRVGLCAKGVHQFCNHRSYQ